MKKTISMKTALLMMVATGMMSFGGAYAQSEAVNADDFLEGQPAAAGAQSGDAAPVSSLESSSPAGVQDAEIKASLEAAKAELADEAIMERKLELAKKMHQIRPTRNQVDSAVARASLSLPDDSRASFVNVMRGMLNYNAIERISIDSMVETYTLKELESMVEYYSKPEAKSASDKVQYWAQGVHPEIVRMIDKAMIRLRTGQ